MAVTRRREKVTNLTVAHFEYLDHLSSLVGQVFVSKAVNGPHSESARQPSG
jgi:hypothetical protein